MKTFHCDHCGNLLFFQNTLCIQCGRQQTYLPDVGVMKSLGATEGDYRLCRNYTDRRVCNWAVAPGDSHSLCVSCRLTHIIPDLSQPGNHEAWYRLELAKRRVIFTVLGLGLPILSREDDPEQGLAFEFKNGTPYGAAVVTGHQRGVITINLAEADDSERERQRVAVREPYRTVLGHIRHEIGHYYWDQLIATSENLGEFRNIFGDERQNYCGALQTYYEQGPAPDWPNQCVTAYASAHPWEDWAETWAHYFHITDALETAAGCGISLRPGRLDEPSMDTVPLDGSGRISFRSLIDYWFPLSYALNSLNRSLGLPDAYPFVLSSAAIAKLRFVHDTIEKCGSVNRWGQWQAVAA